MALAPSMNDNCRHDHQSRMQSREGDAHVVTCVMSWLVYDNSMALPPWLPWKNRASWVASVRRESHPIAKVCLPVICLCQSCTFWHASPVTRVRGVCDAVFKYLPCGFSLRSGTGGDGVNAGVAITDRDAGRRPSTGY